MKFLFVFILTLAAILTESRTSAEEDLGERKTCQEPKPEPRNPGGSPANGYTSRLDAIKFGYDPKRNECTFYRWNGNEKLENLNLFTTCATCTRICKGGDPDEDCLNIDARLAARKESSRD
uniref:BPTI/Kunitz inhibitor domain-containing protein n=1 Tax=Rhipicephalus zambeziensis TaxID=60191 RepID=A0A224YHE8_9ACAR